MRSAKDEQKQKHFVLVHGACHGAWCWFKLKPLLEAAGHRVSAFDLSASGTNTKLIQHVPTLADYSLPLLEFMATIPPEKKVVLVGHSLGGMSLSLAMEMFPEKVSVAIFLCAFMPDSVHKPSYVLDQYMERTPTEAWMDTQFLPYNAEKGSESSMFFGPNYLSSKLYQHCSIEDIELGKTLIRPGSLFLKDLAKAKHFTEGGYGSVKRVYVVCEEDLSIKEEFQRWMIENNPVVDVKELIGADHMPMLSNPKQLSVCLLDIALRYAYIMILITQYMERTPTEAWMDTQFLPYNAEKESESSMFFGPNYLSSKLYQHCSIEDIELGKTLIRPGSLFLKDLAKAKHFTEGGYGSVKRVYVVCEKDLSIKEEFQRWMIENNPVVVVKELIGADHMPMLSNPKQLSVCLLDIALQYA